MTALPLLNVHIDEELIGVLAIVLGILCIVLPSIVFGTASKWAKEQRDLAGPILAGAVAITIVAVLAAATLTLALCGWLPPLTELIGGKSN